MPYLAWRIDNYNNGILPSNTPQSNGFTFNLKGILVGNGVTNWKWDGDTAYIEMAKFHGLYGPAIWDQMAANGCNYYYEDNAPVDSAICEALYIKFQILVKDINVYDINRECYSADVTSTGR